MTRSLICVLTNGCWFRQYVVGKALKSLLKDGGLAGDDELKNLHKLESKLLTKLEALDNLVDRSLEDAHSYNGKFLRWTASFIGWWGERTPILGEQLVRLKNDIVSRTWCSKQTHSAQSIYYLLHVNVFNYVAGGG